MTRSAERQAYSDEQASIAFRNAQEEWDRKLSRVIGRLTYARNVETNEYLVGPIRYANAYVEELRRLLVFGEDWKEFPCKGTEHIGLGGYLYWTWDVDEDAAHARIVQTLGPPLWEG